MVRHFKKTKPNKIPKWGTAGIAQIGKILARHKALSSVSNPKVKTKVLWSNPSDRLTREACGLAGLA